jgi:hypothetical protein
LLGVILTVFSLQSINLKYALTKYNRRFITCCKLKLFVAIQVLRLKTEGRRLFDEIIALLYQPVKCDAPAKIDDLITS